MAFVQIIEFTTSRIDEMRAVEDEWEKSTEGKRSAGRRILCQDRDHPDRYLQVVFFESYETAMENSALPETDMFSTKFMKLSNGPATFHNLEVIDDRD